MIVFPRPQMVSRSSAGTTERQEGARGGFAVHRGLDTSPLKPRTFGWTREPDNRRVFSGGGSGAPDAGAAGKSLLWRLCLFLFLLGKLGLFHPKPSGEKEGGGVG